MMRTSRTRKRIAKWLNTITAVFLASILTGLVVNATMARHPWAITCYSCKACASRCPLGIDPSGYVTAALTANPDYMMDAANLRLSLEEANRVDPDMVIECEGTLTSPRKALEQQTISPRSEVRVYKMKAKHAARYDLLCGNCQKMCPINLSIEDIIRDLRTDGTFDNLKPAWGAR